MYLVFGNISGIISGSIIQRYQGCYYEVSIGKIIEGHNGRIWTESKGRGKGSAFFVELPAGE